MQSNRRFKESTPLIQQIPVAPHPPRRYPHSRLRLLSTALLALICVVGFGLFFLDVDDIDGVFSLSHKSKFTFSDLKRIVLTTPNEEQVREWSKYYTSGPHLAGKNLSQAEWTRDRWQEFGVEDTSIVAYDVYINYPKGGNRLALLETHSDTGKTAVKFEASLEEDVLDEDPTTSLPNRIPTFHGYSASGNVTAQYVWANYGTFKDFDDLVKANVSLEGKIAVVRYEHVFRGLKVKRAQELGMIGVVIYTDPGDDGGVTEKTNATYPNGPAREASSVQRGSVQFLSYAPGDPTTPGYPSKPGCPRSDTTHAIPQIPSIPISYADALPILRALNGHGPKATDFNEFWQSGGLGFKGVEYNIGPSPSELTPNLVNQQEYVTTPLWNVIGVINGTLSDEVIVLGNHRDAWIAGGAADPNSGSAAFNEVIRGLGIALSQGWKPLRTIVLASWDGEEYGLVGSTEWVEEYLPWLSDAAVAYVNVDVGAAGSVFSTASAPLLNKVLIETLQSVPSPNNTVHDQTVYDVWKKHISTIGSGSDFTAFQDFAGVPSLDMGFKTAKPGPIYQYHSNYDSFHWMDNFGDPDWVYHTTIAKVWGLLTAKLVDEPLIPFNATDYAVALQTYVRAIKSQVAKAAEDGELAVSDVEAWKLNKLSRVMEDLHIASIMLDSEAAALRSILAESTTLSDTTQAQLKSQIKTVNTKYKYLERQFIYQVGLDDRSWFKHVVYAPGRWTGYAGATLPGLVESVEDNDEANFEKWEDIVVERVKAAIKLLEG